uniref:Uncharacterized protein n=1 Tax=Tetranychus urticae TaxID=32264 RepID=T1L0K7_TETUR
MSRIYGAATGDPRLSINYTPSTVVREARKCAKIGEKLLVITASFNGIKNDNAHSRLVIIYRDTSYRMTVYDPLVPLEVSPGSIEKIIAKKLNIRYADIASGTQKLGERTSWHARVTAFP